MAASNKTNLNRLRIRQVRETTAFTERFFHSGPAMALDWQVLWNQIVALALNLQRPS